MWYMILLIAILIIIGFIVIVIDVRKSVDEFNFANEYYERFTKLVADVLEKKTFKNKEYTWLMSNSDKMQNILGDVGIISYMERNRMYNNIPILLNVMNEIVSYANDSYVSQNDIKMINWCENAFLRRIGILDEFIKNEPKKTLNPFYDLTNGIKCILSIPINILYSIGLISYKGKNKIQQNIIFRVLSGLLSLLTIFSTIMSIIIGWDEFIIKTLVDFAPQADKACTNVSRLFHGTNGEEKEVIMLDKNAIITLDDVVKIYTPNNKETINKKDKDFWDIVKNYDWLDYIKQDNIVDGRESGDRVDFLICPICRHKKDFSYYKSTHSFCCYGVNGNINGSIIDYLVATKNITKKEAIDVFKYEFLGISKEEEKQKFLDDNGGQQEDLMVIQQQLNSINLNAGYIEDANWLEYFVTKYGELIRKVNCPKLAQFIRENIYYIFVRNNAKSTTLRYFYLDGYYKLVSDDEIKGLIKLCIPLEWQRTKDINEVLNLLYTDLKFVPIEKLNADENIINFNNGVLHLDTMELKPHSPKQLSTIRIPCNYYEYVEAPATHYFDNFINDLTNGDEEVKQLLLQIMGVTISNIRGSRMKQALFMVGPGNSGKSKLKIFLTSLIGAENCSSIDLKMLQKQFSKIQLLNKRLVGTNDMSWMNLPEIDTFKQATGGDLINAEYKGENGIDFTFNGVLWFCGNKLPRFGGDKGEWTYNRIIVVECNNVIPEEKRDSFLDDHLIEESDYIISLCIKALQKVIKNGYKYDIPEVCKTAKKRYEIDNDSFLSFYEECIVDRDLTKPIMDYCTKGKIFEVYKAYCKDNNKNHFNTKKEVKQILEKKGKNETTYARGGNIYYKYITLSKEANIEYGDICPWPQPDITAEDVGITGGDYNF